MSVDFNKAGVAIAEFFGLQQDSQGRYELPGGPKTPQGVVRMIWRALADAGAQQRETVVVDLVAGTVTRVSTPAHIEVLVCDYDSDRPDDTDPDQVDYKARFFHGDR